MGLIFLGYLQKKFMNQASKIKIEYGDFQTPLELAEKICHKLISLNISPNVIFEPTCGIGNFIKASTTLFKLTNKIIGLEINPNYLEAISKDEKLSKNKKIHITQEDFFSFDDEETAYKTFEMLTSPLAIDFYSSLIFWDEKRPIKTSILNSLDLSILSEQLSTYS